MLPAAAAAGSAGASSNAAMLGSAGISAGGGLIGSIINARQQSKARKWQEKMMREGWKHEDESATTAYLRQLEFWNKENAYNTPAAQLARMLEAGINPNAFDPNQNMAASPPNVDKAQTPSAPTAAQYDIASPLLQGLNNSFTNMKDYQEARIKKSEADVKDDLMTLTKQQMESAIRKINAEVQLTDAQNHQINQLTPLLCSLNKNQADLLFQEAQKVIQETNLTIAMTSKTQRESGKISAETDIVKLQKAREQLKNQLVQQYGIVIDEGDAAACISLLLSPHSGVVVNTIMDSFGRMYRGFFEGGKTLVNNMVQGFKNSLSEMKNKLKFW